MFSYNSSARVNLFNQQRISDVKNNFFQEPIEQTYIYTNEYIFPDRTHAI